MAKAKKKRARRPPRLLLFVDTNIWLDFYRGRSEASLKLLGHLESDAVRDCLIVTHQLEMEYKKNRQAAILEGMKTLTVAPAPRLGVFSDAAAFRTAERALKTAAGRVQKLKTQLSQILENPITHDPVYQACQRLFHRSSPLVLTRKDEMRRIRHQIRNRALRRFLLGCPPRKGNETSMGDALNWEWMIECVNSESAGLVIVSRDADYGMEFEQTVYLNEHLLHEFKERVSKQRPIILCRKLSDALKHFNVTVTAAEEKEEKEVAEAEPVGGIALPAFISQAQSVLFERDRALHEAQQQIERQILELIEMNTLRKARAAAAQPPPAEPAARDREPEPEDGGNG